MNPVRNLQNGKMFINIIIIIYLLYINISKDSMISKRDE